MKIQKADGSVVELSSVSKAKEKDTKSGKSYMEKFKQHSEAIQQDIAERGTIQGSIGQGMQQGGIKGYGRAALEILGAIPGAVESGISNPALALQAGNVGAVPKEMLSGLLGQKRGRYSDVYKGAGVNPLLAEATGLFLSIAGTTKALNYIGNTFGKISKMSDKGIEKAGYNLINATKKATSDVGKQVGQAFAPYADDAVDGLEFINQVVKMPGNVLKRVEEVFGNMDDFAQNLTVGKLRELKSFLGKHKPTAFGKEALGASENIEIEAYNRVYGGIKNLLRETIKSTRGAEVSDALMKLEKSFSEVSRASNLINKTTNNSVLRMPTEAGKIAKGVIKEGDTSIRKALNIVRDSGRAASKEVNSAMRQLRLYNESQAIANFARSATKAAVFGGAAGAIGGKVLQKVAGSKGRD